MRDPHVVSLHYRMKHGEGITFVDPPPIACQTSTFDLWFEDGKLDFTLKEHFASVQEARDCVTGFLRAWEVDISLRFGKDEEIKFVYEDAKVVDRDPPPPGTSQSAVLQGCIDAQFSLTANLSVGRRQYPEPPKGFIASSDVETMLHRFQGYLDGREPLASMAYFCVTLLEQRAKQITPEGRLLVFKIHKNVRQKLGYLISEVGIPTESRKFRISSHNLTNKEKHWIEEAIKLMIRRKGEYDFDPSMSASLPLINLSDLPDL